MISRVQCELDDEAITRIADTVAAWRGQVEVGASVTEYQDVPGFCRSVPLAEIAEHGHVLTPGRYVGAEAVEDDDEAFADKMQQLTEKLGEQMSKGAELDENIMTLELTPLRNAVQRLAEGLARYQRDITDIQIRDGLIQRFEFTYELSHKMLKRYLEAAAANPTEFDGADFQYLVRSGNEQ
eukprot:gene42983-53708_t